MAHQQNQPQLQRTGIGQGHQQAELAQQRPEFQQPQFQQSQPQQLQAQQPVQQTQQPVHQRTPPQPNRHQVPQQPIQHQTPQQPIQHQASQQPIQQQPSFAAQSQQAWETPQTQALPQSAQTQTQLPQTQAQQPQLQAQLPQTVGQQLPQQTTGQQPAGQQSPHQTAGQQPQQSQVQWGAQTSGRSSGLGAPPSGQSQVGPSPTGQSIRAGGQVIGAGGQSIPSQGQQLGAFQQAGEQSQQELAGTPNVDVVDTPDEVVLFVDMPGYEEDDIRIQADGQNLTVSATRGDEEETEEGRRFAQERPRKLQRTIRLPSRANVNEADATFENGVCTIRLPKMEEEKQHEIAFQ